MSITTFHYGIDGEAEWLTALGLYVASEETGTMGIFEGPVLQATDGQCIGCGHVEPIYNDSVQGTMTITFSDYRHAVLEWRVKPSPSTGMPGLMLLMN